MKFEWDESKRRLNLQKHRLDFADAVEIFNAPMLIHRDDRTDYDEERWIGLGILKGIIVVAVFVESDGLVRIISLRKALKREREYYENKIFDGLG